MKRYVRTAFAMLAIVFFLSSFSAVIYSFQPPEGHTGAGGVYCNQCHNTNPLNNAGGNVTVAGLPDEYTPGTSYTFNLTTTHSAADRKRWGFSIEARNALDQAVGTFSTTNPNAGINGAELSHESAVATNSQSAYTYNNLTWNAPANPTADDQNITFYFVGNAADGSGTAGDYIYAGTKTMVLSLAKTYTFTGNGNWEDPANWSNNTVPPLTLPASATIVIDPPVGSECVLNVEQHIPKGATFTVKKGKAFRIAGGLIITQ